MRMNSPPARSRARQTAQAEPFQTEFARQIAKWRRLRTRSAGKPSAGAVHDLRVATLRLQAGIEYWAGQRHDHSLSRDAARWIAQSRKLREVLGEVRDADVTLGKLKMLREEMLGSNGAAPVDAPECMREIKKLEREVKRTRRAGARELVDWLEEQGTRLEKRMLRLEKELDQLNPFPAGCGRVLLSEFLSGQASSPPKLNRKTLHEFRKQLKKVRYLTEISASGERSHEVLSIPLRKLQSALGEWHDWDALVRTARRALGARGEAACLVQRLEDRAVKALRSALAQTRRSLVALSAGVAKRRPLR